jgi:hypothetical protein
MINGLPIRNLKDFGTFALAVFMLFALVLVLPSLFWAA